MNPLVKFGLDDCINFQIRSSFAETWIRLLPPGHAQCADSNPVRYAWPCTMRGKLTVPSMPRNPLQSSKKRMRT